MASRNYTTPWFGTWPPEVRGDSRVSKTGNWREKWTAPLLLFSTFLGIVLIIVSAFNEGVWFTALRDIAIALLITGGLGLTVDKLLRQQLAMDAFNASMGYLLPPQLKPELEWIYKQEIIATKHHQSIKVIPLDQSLVKVEVKINRTFENITQHKATMTPLVSVDEWFHKGYPSAITEFGCSKFTKDQPKPVRGEYSLQYENVEEIVLLPGETVETWVTYSETKYRTDDHSNTFLCPTANLFIEVEAGEGLKIRPGFAMHKQHTLKIVGENRYELAGTLLPGQQIMTHWWDIEEAKKWQKQEG